MEFKVKKILKPSAPTFYLVCFFVSLQLELLYLPTVLQKLYFLLFVVCEKIFIFHCLLSSTK